MKRACATIGAVRKSRIGKFQIRGAERKKHMEAYDEETAEGKVDLIYGRIEQMVDEAAKVAGLTKRQYADWKRIERMGNSTKNNRGRSLSKRRKDKREANERVGRESSANRRDRQRKADKERKKKEEQDKRSEEKQKRVAEETEGWRKAMRREKADREQRRAVEKKRGEEIEEKRREEERKPTDKGGKKAPPTTNGTGTGKNQHLDAERAGRQRNAAQYSL